MLQNSAGRCAAATPFTTVIFRFKASFVLRFSTISAIFAILILLPGGRALSQGEAPLSVSTAISEALNSSPQARAARFERDAALARTDKERPIARPTAQAVVSGGVQGPRVTYPGAPGSDTTVLPEEMGRVDLIIEQPLYHAGARPARMRYNAETALVDLDYRKALASIASNIQKLFVDLRRAESAVRIADEGAVAARQYHDLVQHLIDAGSGRPVDLQTANGQVAEAEAGVAEAQNGLKLAKFAINQAIGRPLTSGLNSPTTSTETAVATVQPTLPAQDEAIRSAQVRRPEIVELQLELAAAKSGVTLARSQSQPNLVARGQVTEQTPSVFVHEHYASAMLEIKLPILDNDKTKLDTKEAVAQVNRLEALIDQAKSGVALDVVRSLAGIQNAEERLKAATVQVSASEASHTVAVTAYSVGRATAGEVQTSMRDLKQAKAGSETNMEIDVFAQRCLRPLACRPRGSVATDYRSACATAGCARAQKMMRCSKQSPHGFPTLCASRS